MIHSRFKPAGTSARAAVMYGIAATLACLSLASAAEPVKVKAVIVAMFEVGADTGDRPGEFQFWVEREKLDRVLPFPAGYHPLRTNADGSVLGVTTGQGVTNAATSIMALGLDPRFDLSKAYWIVAGIAGIDPEDGSLGSAAWANFVLDGDLVREIDSREAPAGWPYARFAPGAKKPNTLPWRLTADSLQQTVFRLNPALVEWAFELTKEIKLEDTPAMAAYRAAYKSYPNAVRPPFVLKGDSLGSSTYWHGKVLTQWANDWVKLWTQGKGNFVMTNMEDNATAMALQRLSHAHKADFNRVLFLRTASNFCMQAPGQTAEDSATAGYAGALPSLEAAYRVGSPVLHEIVKNWSKWENTIPGK
jgi:purine nucleoside permease